MEAYNRRAQSRLQLGLIHRFWTILGGIFAGFIILEQLVQGLHLGHAIQAKFLEIPSQRVHQAPLVSIELRESPWVLLRLRLVLDDVIDGTVEDHKPGGVTRSSSRRF
jgi:hypothetical protein